MDPVTLVGFVVLVASTLLLAVALWNALAWPSVGASGPETARAVAILIPARDEEHNIGACLEAAVAQGPTVAEILVYDDHSSDRTPHIVREYSRLDARVRLVAPRSLPAGWCGKNFACATLAAEAAAPWLLYVDADARLERDAARRLLAEAFARQVTLLSPWPRLIARSLGERVLMPMLDVIVFTLFPAHLSLRRDDPSLGLVHGACILVQKEAYDRVGGHGAVRGAILEDQLLVRHWRASGERSACLFGRDVVGVRMYRSVGELWRGFRKNFFPAFRHTSSFWAFLLLHGVGLGLPFLLLGIPSMAAAAAAITTMRAVLALRFGHHLWSALLHPVAALFLLALGLASWWRVRSGRGVEWKGRTYHGDAAAAGGVE